MSSSKPKPRSGEPALSMAAENYLLSIFRMQEQGMHVTATQLAKHLKTLPADEGLGTSLPSVGGMIRRMGREGLLKTDQSKGVILTKKGRRSAEGIVRRHRLAERMVVDLLGVELQYSHLEAHRLEHAISDQLEKKIAARLGYPKTCPFGHPVPGSGYHPPENAVSLDKVPPGQELTIDRVPEDDQSLLEYFVDRKFIPGQIVVVKETATSLGVITVECDGNNVTFSYEVAAKIWVRPRNPARAVY